MKQIVKSLIMAGSIIAAYGAKADAVAYYDVTPYIGADYNYIFMKPTANWNQILPKAYQGASIYIGTTFHPSFAIELGYDWSIQQKKSWNLVQGQSFFGSKVNAPFAGTTHLERTSGHLDLVGILPVAECTDLLGFIGVGWVQPKITIVNMSVAPNGNMPNSSAIASVSGSGRGVFRMGIGARYMLTDIIGLRAKMGWESTSTLAVKGNAFFPALGYTTRAFKGSTTFALGAFITF